MYNMGVALSIYPLVALMVERDVDSVRDAGFESSRGHPLSAAPPACSISAFGTHVCNSLFMGGVMRSIPLMIGVGVFMLGAVSGCDSGGSQQATYDREMRAAEALDNYTATNRTALAQAQSMDTYGWPASAKNAFSTALNTYQEAFDAYYAREGELLRAGLDITVVARQLEPEQAKVDAARAEFMAVVGTLSGR